MPKAFRIERVSDPVGVGAINQQYRFEVHFSFDPEAPLEERQGVVFVVLRDHQAHSLASGQVDQDPFIEVAKARISYFVASQLSIILASPDPSMRHVLNLSNDDVDALLRVDPNRVDLGGWQLIEEQPFGEIARVFISCGQASEEERQLGAEISRLVEEHTTLEAYFAEDQASVEGLTTNIFNALYSSVAFIAVMHRRGEELDGSGDYRGSVWIEQEIALAAFIVQTLGKSLPTRAYVESGIRREGVRGFIILNPIEFETNEDIIQDLEDWLPSLADAVG